MINDHMISDNPRLNYLTDYEFVGLKNLVKSQVDELARTVKRLQDALSVDPNTLSITADIGALDFNVSVLSSDAPTVAKSIHRLVTTASIIKSLTEVK